MKNNELMKQITKFVVVGGIAFIIDYLVLILLKELLGLNVLISAAIAFTISVIYNYFASVKYVFKVDDNSTVKKNFIIFVFFSIVGLIITEVIIDIGVNKISINYLVVKIIATAVVMVFNFITRKIFLEEDTKNKIIMILKKDISKKIINTIFAVLSYLTLCSNGIIVTYNIFSLILICMLIFLYNRYFKIVNKKYKAITVISIIFSIMLVMGNLCLQNIDLREVSIFKEFFSLRQIIFILGYFGIINTILINVIPKLCKIRILKNNNYKITKNKLFILTFIIFILSWLPYLFSMFPGTLSGDSVGELRSAINNVINSDHHTVAHLLIIRMCAIIGGSRLSNAAKIVCIYNVIQMIAMSLVFSRLITFLYDKKVNKKIIAIVIIYFAITPIFGYYSIVMWKDIWFGIISVLFMVQVYRIYEERDNIKLKRLIIFSITSLFTIFFRNNAIYMYYILALITFIVFKKEWKKFVIIFLIVFGTYYTVKGPIFNYFNIAKSASSEYIGMPMQQIGRMAYKNVEFTSSERKQINKILNVEIMKDAYNPRWSDGIKFNKNFNCKPFNDNKIGYAKLYLKLISKYPTIAVEAHAISTLGYWYPNIQDRAYETTISTNDYNLEPHPIAPEIIKQYVLKMGDRDNPIFSITWSIGLLVWLVIISMYIAYKRKGLKFLYVYVPIFGIWLSLLVASPVYNEIRYIFALFTCLPLLIIAPYLKEEKRNLKH